MTVTRVSFSKSFQPVKLPGTETAGAHLLDPAGPKVVLGWSKDDFATAVTPTKSVLFGPRGVCLHPDGSLWVADTGHHRLLGWRECPTTDNQDADIVIGQPDFTSEGRNAKGDTSSATMDVPTGLCVWRGGLVLADPWNHRVLIWSTPPTSDNQPADIILGQENGHEDLANSLVLALALRSYGNRR